jgi:hypothetical protein
VALRTLPDCNFPEMYFFPMFLERKLRYSALSTYLVGWHASAISFPPSDIILA